MSVYYDSVLAGSSDLLSETYKIEHVARARIFFFFFFLFRQNQGVSLPTHSQANHRLAPYLIHHSSLVVLSKRKK